MNPSELFRNGKLNDAITELSTQVREKPDDQNKRLFLFELLAFAGNLERAKKQLEAIQYDQTELMLAISGYRNCLSAEETRRKIFQGVKPNYFSNPPDHIKLREQAFECLGGKNYSYAADLFSKANSALPGLKGQLNGKSFDVFRDADDFFAGLFEVYSTSKYYWVPFEDVENIEMSEPKTPRDLIFIPTKLTLKNGESGSVYLPALYLGSHEKASDQVKLGRENDWVAIPDSEIIRGYGRKIFVSGETETDILSIRQLTFN